MTDLTMGPKHCPRLQMVEFKALLSRLLQSRLHQFYWDLINVVDDESETDADETIGSSGGDRDVITRDEGLLHSEREEMEMLSQSDESGADENEGAGSDSVGVAESRQRQADSVIGCGIAVPKMSRMRDINGAPDKAHLIPNTVTRGHGPGGEPATTPIRDTTAAYATPLPLESLVPPHCWPAAAAARSEPAVARSRRWPPSAVCAVLAALSAPCRDPARSPPLLTSRGLRVLEVREEKKKKEREVGGEELVGDDWRWRPTKNDNGSRRQAANGGGQRRTSVSIQRQRAAVDNGKQAVVDGGFEGAVRNADELSKMMAFFYYGATKPPCLDIDGDCLQLIPSVPDDSEHDK
ncbi:hypothetical protein Scep_015878 [Stephania cephalantha]|uniref:Uncharacterized protein n=1 Tax=Stephania cephalantha TaxID=152367 RepID=A0AAP0IM45_9MAGN